MDVALRRSNMAITSIIRATIHYMTDADAWLDTMLTAIRCGDADGAVGCLHAAYWRLQRAGVLNARESEDNYYE